MGGLINLHDSRILQQVSHPQIKEEYPAQQEGSIYKACQQLCVGPMIERNRTQVGHASIHCPSIHCLIGFQQTSKDLALLLNNFCNFHHARAPIPRKRRQKLLESVVSWPTIRTCTVCLQLFVVWI